jgi:hypothetical protein
MCPTHPIPVIDEPFSRIAMDIGQQPCSCSIKKYVLVICDYRTRYPEATPLGTIDTEHAAEELVMVLTRVGVPEEVLTDQGSDLTSQWLAEVYQLLQVKPSIICRRTNRWKGVTRP